MHHSPFVFWGNSEISVSVLEKLKSLDVLPVLIVTGEDKKAGRQQVLTETPVSAWAQNESVPTLKPKDLLAEDFLAELKKVSAEVFVLVSYGRIIPQELLTLPKYGFLNLHPSLLPLYRGATPIETVIYAGEKKTGVSIISLDNLIDHGPILAQSEPVLIGADETTKSLSKKLASAGAVLLKDILPALPQKISLAKPQNEHFFTMTKRLKTENGELVFPFTEENSVENWRIFRAYGENPGAYFYFPKAPTKMRIKVLTAKFSANLFEPIEIVPEGKKKTTLANFLHSFNSR